MLWCKLTKLTIPKIPEKVQRHVNSSRFVRLRKEAETGENNLLSDIDDKNAEFWVNF